MKKLSNMMLAAVAAAAIATPAMAWDFGATGSAEATFNQTTTVSAEGQSAVVSGGFASDAGAITLKSSNTDGDHSATLTYALDWDGNLDEVWTLSGSTKSGKWTASASIDYNNDEGAQTAQDAPAITLTDGSMTIIMGNAGHLSNARKGADGTAAGRVTMLGTGEANGGYDFDIGAVVDSFQGISVGMAVDANTTVTAAYQNQSAGSIMGVQGAADGETNYSASGFGLSVAADVGASVALTFGSGSTKSAIDGQDNSTTYSTMGLGVSMDLGSAVPALTYATTAMTSNKAEGEHKITAMELSVTAPVGDDSVVFNYSNAVHNDGTNSGAQTGIELGYGTTVGAVALSVGYGSTTVANEDSVAAVNAKGYTMSDIEVKMAYSF
jgi:hypothetical protein